MTMTPRELAERQLARREKIMKRYYWNGFELRLKETGQDENAPVKKQVKKWSVLRRQEKVRH